jgi:hypothetical protein
MSYLNLNIENIEGEIWKQLQNPQYFISNKGRLKSHFLTKDKILKQFINKKGYCTYVIKNVNTILIHRLVALYFISNPNNYPQVNHIDGNKNNNKWNNLEWCTNQENQNHSKYILKSIKKGKSILQFTKNNILIKKYISISQASKETKINTSNINSCCKGKLKTAGKFKWKYEN